MLQTSLLLIKSLNKTDSHFLICSVFFVSKGNLFDVYSSFTQEDIFIQFSLMSLCKTRDPFCIVIVDPRTII